MTFKHIPVLLNEVISALEIKEGGVYLDCTLGGGGHSYEIAKQMKNGKLYCVDKDSEAIEAGKEKLKEFDFVKFIKSDFKNLETKILFQEFDGILLDLGVSSHQIDTASRGFSFMQNAKLDMRMDSSQKLSAFEVVNNYKSQELEKILFEYGEEKFAKQIVEKIVKQRNISPIKTTLELKEIVESAIPSKYKFSGGCQKTFQAIRIEVNGELTGLYETLVFLISKLKPKGRIAVITFHSLEDRIVKNAFRDCSIDCICPPKTPVCICGHHASLKLINKKPIVASLEELKLNSRSHSAKLRIGEKI